ncbi:hypothetical protein MIND_00058500 [Mycena indigotica]|uniref:Uncharacterized protein n=1 Tax=Mycena indigotica TaxID=2126181 RepID=A0A8H6WG42_9AGAR|nr:uncharacterized protein MIND_00058500 [Mycena indigotica]KAF7315436.1 hypothetical protein MIND_00058500 [Mycena indigotica]
MQAKLAPPWSASGRPVSDKPAFPCVTKTTSLPFVFPPSHLTHRQFLALTEDLRVPWNIKKSGTAFEPVFVSLGFVWDIPSKTVSLPKEKREKYLARVESLLGADMVSLKDLQKVHGTLSYSTFVYRDGSSRLPAISNAFRFYANDNALRHILRTTRRALLWWKHRLTSPDFSRQLVATAPMQDLGLFVDASTSWGLGVIIGEKWFALRLIKGWDCAGTRDICWLEAVALEVLLMWLIERGHHDCCLLVHSDNTGAIGALSKGRSSNAELNRVARRFCNLSLSHNISISFSYIASASNPADPISRGILPHSFPLYLSFDLPFDITQSLSCVDYVELSQS